MTKIKEKNTSSKKNNKLASDTIKKPEKKKKEYVRKWGNQFSQVFTDEEIERIADEMLTWFEETDVSKPDKPKNIWLKDFAIEKRINRQRFVEFAERNEYFKFIYEICKWKQESILFKLGLSKDYNSSMPIFGLKNLGWKDNINVETSDKTINLDKIMEKLLLDPAREPYLRRLSSNEDPQTVLLEYERASDKS